MQGTFEHGGLIDVDVHGEIVEKVLVIVVKVRYDEDEARSIDACGPEGFRGDLLVANVDS